MEVSTIGMKEFIKGLEQRNLFLVEREGDLILKGRKGKLTKEDIAIIKNDNSITSFIKDNKPQLLRFLRTDSQTESLQLKYGKRPTAIYELSPLQEGLLFHGLYDSNSNAYTSQYYFDLSEKLQEEALKSSWDFVFKNHTILRSSFVHDQLTIPVQCVFDDITIPFEVIDYSDLSPEELAANIDTFLEKDLKKGFDFNQPPLMRINLIKKGDGGYKMIWTFHHILLDGWSFPIIIKELLSAYDCFIQGETPNPKEEDHYEDFIKYINAKDKNEEERFWKDYMEGFEDPSLLPLVANTKDRNKGIDETTELDLIFDEGFTTELRAFARKNRLTVNTLIQGVWSILLSKYTGNKDITYGVTVSGRPADLNGAEQKVGLFINTLPLRTIVNDKLELGTWLEELQQGHTSAREYQYTQLSQIQNWAGIRGDFFDSILVFENYPIGEMLEQEWSLEIEDVSTNSQTNYLLTIEVDMANVLKIEFSYNNKLISDALIGVIKGHFENVLREIVKAGQTNIKIGEIKLLPEDERQVILGSTPNEQGQWFNQGAKDLGNTDPINVRFEKIVAQDPTAIAISQGKNFWRYAKLNKWSNQVSHSLQEMGVKAGDFVAIYLDRTPEMIGCLLGILKSGAIYVPLDTQNPAERIEKMITGSDAKVVISNSALLENLETIDAPGFLLVDDCSKTLREKQASEEKLINDISDIIQKNDKNLVNQNEMTSWAYMLYTSGSTGDPKGAITRHDGAMNHILAEYKALELEDGFRFLQSAGIGSDISVWQILGPLLKGGKVVLIDKFDLLDCERMFEILEEERVDIVEFVPSYLWGLVDHLHETEGIPKLEDLKWIMMVGEEVPVRLVNEVHSFYPHLRLLNAYGPCEASDDVTQYEIKGRIDESQTRVPIGQPIDNINILILDGKGDLCPIGVAGELCVTGVGVGVGYKGLPEKTAASFINNPFPGTLGKTLYKTGDLARWLPDGNVDFLGRIDRQVKIRGNRVELGEIEAFIRAESAVKEVHIIIDKSDETRELLIAFVSLLEDTFADAKQSEENRFEEVEASIRKRCQGGLPYYMQPTHFLLVEKMPLNLSDKIDSKKLLKEFYKQNGDLQEVTRTKTAPRNDAEKELVDIWKTLLDIPDVCIYDNFFEVGGHSLKATRLVSHIYKRLGTKLTIREVFDCPTIAEQSNLLEKRQQQGYQAIPRVESQPFYLTSNAQKRLWIIDQIEDDLIAYNSSSIFKMSGDLDIDIFLESVGKVVDRHEILRTTFVEINGEPMQRIHSAQELGICTEIVDLREQNWQEEEILTSLRKRREEALDLQYGPLFKSAVYLLPNDEYLVFILMHHITSDGWSINQFFKECLSIYRKLRDQESSSLLPELPIQYKDYAAWQIQQLESEEFKRHREFWLDTFAGDIPVINFPSFKERPNIQTYEGQTIQHKFSLEQLNWLNEISSSSEGSLFMTLTALVNILLYKYTAQEDIILGAATSGRNHPDLEEQIGYYINTVAMRNQVPADRPFMQFLQEVKQSSLNYLEHEDYPFDLLINELDYDRDISRNPLFDIMIILQNYDENEEDLIAKHFESLSIEPLELGTTSSPFDMDFDFSEQKDGLQLFLTFNTNIYEPYQIERLIAHFGKLMDELRGNPQQTIGAIDMVTDAEKQEIVAQFNDTEKELPLSFSFTHYLEKFAKETPTKTAVICNDHSLNYEELNKQANQLARTIQKKEAIGPNDLVAIYMDRSEKMMMSILAVWKAGAAYIPIEKKFPDKRILSIVQDAGVKMVIAEEALISEELRSDLGEFCTFDTFENLQQAATQEADHNLDIAIDAESLSFVIFTSGSTGKPKGAMNQHIGMMNHALATVDYLEMDADSVLVQNASHGFDISVWQFFTALITGGTTLVYDDQMVSQPAQLLEDLIVKKATIFQLVPSYLAMLLDLIKEDGTKYKLALRHLICCGEAVKPSLIREWFQLYPSVKVVNDYGPAEASDGTSWYIFDSLEDEMTNIPIGRSIYNMSTYIVDDQMNLCPVGVIGEICVAGVGVGLGYVNDEVRTNSKFIPDPFQAEKSQKLYKTGDLGRYLPNGLLEFHGRKDYQVKVNGQRIELGEIEAKLLQLEQVKDGVVIDKIDQSGRKYLAGYVVFEAGSEVTIPELKGLLGNDLPPYMIPRSFHVMDILPVTPNGKIDRKKLSRIGEVEASSSLPFEVPASEVEQLLANAWRSILKKDKISTNENFYDMGGDSISAIQVASFMYKEGFKAEIKHIMRQATIKELAPFVKPLSVIADQKAVTGYLPLTPIQLDFFNYNKTQANHYNQDVVIVSKEGFDDAAVRLTLEKIQEIHDALRMKYEFHGNQVKQKNMGIDIPLDFVVHDLREEKDPKASMEALATQIHASMNLETGPLMKASLFKLPDADELFISIHHLVVDGVSWRIILDDFANLYPLIAKGEKFDLPLKTDSFKTWSEQLEKYIYSEKFKVEKQYWEQFTDANTEQIPYDHEMERGARKVKDLKEYSIKLDKKYTDLLLTQANNAFNTKINDILLSCLGIASKRTFNLDDLVVALESHGRVDLFENVSIDRTVGWFTCEYPVLLQAGESDDLGMQIKITKEHLHRIPNNGIGYGILQYLSNQTEETKTKPQVVFNYLGQVDNVSSDTPFDVYNSLGHPESKDNEIEYPIELVSVVSDGQFEVGLTYHPSLFKEETITRWMDTYKSVLEEVIDYCTSRQGKELTPSDYDYKDLSINQLEELESLFE